MNIHVTEALKRASLLGGICNWLISPSYGMIDDLTIEKEPKNHKYTQHKDDLSSLSFIDSKLTGINQEVMFEEGLQKIRKSFAAANYSLPSLTSEDVDIWVEGAKAGDLASLYNLGWLAEQQYKEDFNQNAFSALNHANALADSINELKCSCVKSPHFQLENLTLRDLDAMPLRQEKIRSSFLKKAKKQGVIRDVFNIIGKKVEENNIQDLSLLEKGEIFYYWHRAHIDEDPEAWKALAKIYAHGLLGMEKQDESLKCIDKFKESSFLVYKALLALDKINRNVSTDTCSVEMELEQNKEEIMKMLTIGLEEEINSRVLFPLFHIYSKELFIFLDKKNLIL